MTATTSLKRTKLAWFIVGLFEFATIPRRTSTLVVAAGLIASAYVFWTFDLGFLSGRGPFWAYPVGPWLQDTADTHNNVDVLDYLVGYTGLVRSPWALPLFYVPYIGAPTGTSVVFLDVIPIAASIGRVISALAGRLIIPYGVWVGLCFVLSGVVTALFLAEAGQRSLVASLCGCILAMSAPPLLHRFAHFPLMAQFLIIGALYAAMRERRPIGRGSRLLMWMAWLGLAAVINPYMMAMVATFYVAALARSWRTDGLTSRSVEPMCLLAMLSLILFALGYIGSGKSLAGYGYGNYSANLLSPFLPQRSGLFPAYHDLVDATGGQYEGFSYLGFGGLLLLAATLVIDVAGLWRSLLRNVELIVVLLVVTGFALSSKVYFGSYRLLDADIGQTFERVASIYRSSGRMIWPMYYAVLLGSLLFVLRHARTRWQISLTVLACVFQLVDTEPLRARLTSLTDHGGTPVLDASKWSERMKPARFVQIYPTFLCSAEAQQTVDIELQLTAIRASKPFNSVYNPRLQTDCESEQRAAVDGPWASDTLYVYLQGQYPLPSTWVPPGLNCQSFEEGKWCFGPLSP